MTAPNRMLLAVYSQSLALYPAHLRLHYRDQMLQTLRDAHLEAKRTSPFWLHAYADLFESILQENLFMLRNQLSSRPIFFHAVIIGLVLTGMGGAASAVFQQMLRRGADQPQVQMVESEGNSIASGADPHGIIPPNRVDVAQSLEPFTIVYSPHGTPIASSGYLEGTVPLLPRGVFDHTRDRGQERFTWQPRPGVRIASVIQRIDGTQYGFILAGRSLRIVEEQESLFWRIVFASWIVLVLLLTVGAMMLTRAQRFPMAPIAARG